MNEAAVCPFRMKERWKSSFSPFSVFKQLVAPSYVMFFFFFFFSLVDALCIRNEERSFLSRARKRLGMRRRRRRYTPETDSQIHNVHCCEWGRMGKGPRRGELRPYFRFILGYIASLRIENHRACASSNHRIPLKITLSKDSIFHEPFNR